MEGGQGCAVYLFESCVEVVEGVILAYTVLFHDWENETRQQSLSAGLDVNTALEPVVARIGGK